MVLAIACVIEDVCFVDTAAPYSNHILIAFNKQLQPCLVAIRGDPGECRLSKSLAKGKGPTYVVRKESAGIQLEPDNH